MSASATASSSMWPTQSTKNMYVPSPVRVGRDSIRVRSMPRIAINGGRRGFLVQIDPQVCVQLLGAQTVHCALAE